MAHNIQPNTKYRIFTVQVAIAESIEISEVQDGISALLSENQDDFIHDWRYLNPHLTTEIVMSDSNPEEGDIFRH